MVELVLSYDIFTDNYEELIQQYFDSLTYSKCIHEYSNIFKWFCWTNNIGNSWEKYMSRNTLSYIFTNSCKDNNEIVSNMIYDMLAEGQLELPFRYSCKDVDILDFYGDIKSIKCIELYYDVYVNNMFDPEFNHFAEEKGYIAYEEYCVSSFVKACRGGNVKLAKYLYNKCDDIYVSYYNINLRNEEDQDLWYGHITEDIIKDAYDSGNPEMIEFVLSTQHKELTGKNNFKEFIQSIYTE
jgi:hypothetical protein